MNYGSRFSYNLTIAIMDIRQIAMKCDEMRQIKTSHITFGGPLEKRLLPKGYPP